MEARTGSTNFSEVSVFPSIDNWATSSPAADIPSLEETAKQLMAYKVAMVLQKYGTAPIVVIGLVGNTLSLLVMLLPHNRRVSCCVYMGALAVADNGLILSALSHWVITELVQRVLVEWECRLIVFSYFLSSFMGVWLIVGMTMDRFIAVQFPLKASSLCRPWRAQLTCLALLVTLTVYNYPYLKQTAVVGEGKLCAGLTDQGQGVVIYAWISLCINPILPFSLIFVFNMLIIISLQRRPKLLQPEQKTSGAASDETTSSGKKNKGKTKQQERERQLISMLLSVTFALLILTLPIYLKTILQDFEEDSEIARNLARHLLVEHVTNRLFQTNNIINFFIYCLSGSKFRLDVKMLFASCRSGHAFH